MTTFNLKQVTVPLFGEVEKNTTQWLDTFAKGATTPIRVDGAALDLIADELELDAQGLTGDAERYVSGMYRPKARGMGGSRLGDLGEILTFLVNRAVPNREIVRVVSWRADNGQTVKGSRFPQPDFIFSDPGSQAAALEVKSTEAFDFIDLRDTQKKWTWLHPCSTVSRCRDQALPQLAYVNGSWNSQKHKLLVRNGKVVPFPVGQGVATALVAVDGRVNALRTDARLRTPPRCRAAGRNCWLCISSTCHFALVTMPNAPGTLSLAGADHESSSDWLRAYRRWSQALAARDLIAVRSTLAPLAASVNAWLVRAEVREPDVLRAFWGAYLGDAMRTRGFAVELPRELGGRGLEREEFGWRPAPLSRATNREASFEEISQFVLRGGHDGVFPFWLSTTLSGDEARGESLSVGVIGDFLEFRLASNTWWSSQVVASTDAAERIAARLVALALQSSHRSWPHAPFPLREVIVQVGDRPIPLGWESKPLAPDTDDWLLWAAWDSKPWPPWPVLLGWGDPRIRLRVLPDGRAELRMHRALLWRSQ